MRFLFRLDLSLHVGAGKKLEFWIMQLNKGLAVKTGFPGPINREAVTIIVFCDYA